MPRVAGAAGEQHAFVHQPAPEVMASGGGVDKQDPQLCGGVVGGGTEHAPDAAAVHLGDPSSLTGRVVALGVVGDDPGDEGLETAVPAELRFVHLPVGHHPTPGPPAVPRAGQLFRPPPLLLY